MNSARKILDTARSRSWLPSPRIAPTLALQAYRLAERVSGRSVAMAATICFALYPVFFAQSSLAHADLPASALTLWGLRIYFADPQKKWLWALAFALATLAKEIAVVTPLALIGWELFSLWMGMKLARKAAASAVPSSGSWARSVAFKNAVTLLFAMIPLVLWFGYHYQQTGYLLGNPEYFRYNVAATLSPLRVLLALVQRTWQIFGYMNLWILTLLTAAAMLFPPLSDDGTARPRIAIPVQIAFAAIIAANVLFHSLVGGAELARYVMVSIPLVIIIAVSTLRRRLHRWKLAVAFVCVTFVTAWFVNPPFRFAPEDNLAYSDFVRLQQHAIEFISARHPKYRVLTAWPASDELSH